MRVTLRPLAITDAATSWQWRNDPDIWVFTGSKPDKIVTYEMELAWMKEVLNRQNELRFAICVGDETGYIGNCQLTGIDDNKAEFHIFLGDKSYHNLGIGTIATNQLLAYAERELKITEIYLKVHKDNMPAIAVYRKAGFGVFDQVKDELVMKRQLHLAND